MEAYEFYRDVLKIQDEALIRRRLPVRFLAEFRGRGSCHLFLLPYGRYDHAVFLAD